MSSTFAERRTELVYEEDAVSVVVTQHPEYSRDAGYARNSNLTHNAYSLRMLGPKYPAHDANAPIFEGKDIAGLIAGTVITLGPLAAYSLGI